MNQQPNISPAPLPWLWGKIIGGPDALMTADDLARFSDDGDKHEIIRGRLLRMPLPQDEQGSIQVNLATALKVFCKQQNIRVPEQQIIKYYRGNCILTRLIAFSFIL